jgi:hypothetical protein
MISVTQCLCPCKILITIFSEKLFRWFKQWGSSSKDLDEIALAEQFGALIPDAE